MTDQDRGAYTPPTDEALAFDARRQSERRPLPMTLVGSAVVLVVLIVGVAVVYRGGVRGAGEAPRPIGQPVVAVKAPPPVAAATASSFGSTDIGEAKPAAPVVTDAAPSETSQPPAIQGAAAKAKPPAVVAAKAAGPTFAPAPEQPAVRPAPAAKTLALLNQPDATAAPRPKAPPAAGRPVRTAGGLDGLEVAAAGMTGAAAIPTHSAVAPGPTSTPPRATPAPARSAPAKAASVAADPTPAYALPASSATTGAGPVVQIGAFSSVGLSEQGYADVSKIMAGQMAGKAKHVMSVDHGGATLFRTWVSGFTSRTQADAFCAALKARNKPCFVKG